jgi:hypothetical protein
MKSQTAAPIKKSKKGKKKMAYQTIQAQKTYWVQAEIEAPTEAAALELVDAFDIEWDEVDDTDEFSGVFWTESTGLVDDPKDEALRLMAIIKRMKDEFNIPEEDWMN